MHIVVQCCCTGDSYLIASDCHGRRAKQQRCSLVHDEVNIRSLDDRVRAQHKLLPDMHDLLCKTKMQSVRGAGHTDKRWQACSRIHRREETTRTITKKHAKKGTTDYRSRHCARAGGVFVRRHQLRGAATVLLLFPLLLFPLLLLLLLI